jgi:hypothetical protein
MTEPIAKPAPVEIAGPAAGELESSDYVPSATALAPPWTGENSCDDVAARLRQLYSFAIGDTSSWPEVPLQEFVASIDRSMKQFAEWCKHVDVSEEIRTCLVKANELVEAMDCLY